MVGPTWAKNLDGSWHLPDKTLGWGILNWLAAYVRSPDGEGNFIPTLEQARFILWLYAVKDDGTYLYRDIVFRRCKGAGKDPLAAALALVELCGPVAFSHFAEEEPVGKPRHAAWVQVVAVSQDQTRNTMSLFPVMISKPLKEQYSLDVNKTIIYSEAGGRIEAVTSSPYSMEGNRPTFVICNETQWWNDSNDGHTLAGVITGNLTKIPNARRLAICNAHIPGEDSVAERDYDAWQNVVSGQAVDVSVLYDALEAPADTPVSEIPSEKEDPDGYAAGIAKLREGVKIAAGDSYWLPLDAIVEAVLDVRNPVTESRRKHLNQVNASEDSWIAPYEWDAISDTEARLVKGDRITLGFDGSKSNDWTALVACRVEDGCLFLVKAWNPAKYPSEEVPREDVDATVRSMFESYDVLAFRADVREFESYIDNWSKSFGKKLKIKASPNNAIAFDMRGQTKRFSFDCERFLDAVIEQEVTHDGNLTLRQHVLNAKRYPTNFDAISIRKASKDSSRKIDAAVCAVLAYGARHDFLMSKRNRSRKAVVLK
jgi:phage terminase large subunit-like protein